MRSRLWLEKAATVPAALGVLILAGAAVQGCSSHGKGEGKVEAAAAGGEAASVQGTSGAMLNLESFIVNLADPGGGRYLKCTLKIELPSREVLEKVQSDEIMIPRLRDRILTILSSKTADALMTPQGKDLLKREVQSKIDPLFSHGKARQVYITEFLVQ